MERAVAAPCSLCGELAITCGCEGAVERASVVRAHAEAPLSMSVYSADSTGAALPWNDRRSLLWGFIF